MTTPLWDDNPPDDCDGPESHPDGCACVRPGEEIALVPNVYAVDMDGGVYSLPDDFHYRPVCVVSVEDMPPEHCPICMEVAKGRSFGSGKPCPVHGGATKEPM